MSQRKLKASVFKRGGVLLLDSMSRTTSGLWIGTGPFIIDSNSSEDVIGESIVKALSGSKWDVPHPTDWKAVERPILEMAGVKSTAQFMKGTITCDVNQEEDILKLTPYKNSGPKEGFIPLTDEVITIPAKSSPREIGAAVLEALGKSS